jgi:hypothetical protein
MQREDGGENSTNFENQCWMKSSGGEMVPGRAIKERKERKGWERLNSEKMGRGSKGQGKTTPAST